MPIKALAFNSTLKASTSSEASSTGKLLDLISSEFETYGVQTEMFTWPITISNLA